MKRIFLYTFSCWNNREVDFSCQVGHPGAYCHSREYSVRSSISFSYRVDFVIAEYMTTIKHFEPQILDKYPALSKFIRKVQVKLYLKIRFKRYSFKHCRCCLKFLIMFQIENISQSWRFINRMQENLNMNFMPLLNKKLVFLLKQPTL